MPEVFGAVGMYSRALLGSLHCPVAECVPDGKRFLMMKEVGSNATGAEGPRTINIVLNGLEELKQRAPAK
jgi:hypothetical protein